MLTVTFFLTSLCLLPYPGLQNDEVFFASAIYAPSQTPGWVGVFKKPLPIMLLGYLGALKAWLYAPILAIWNPSAWSVRLPVVLLGTLTIWLFYRLSKRCLGTRGALTACALLATDTTYALTTCFDWGPVVLQRLFAVTGVWLLIRFHDTANRLFLGSAFFLFGLAIWDKVLFGWTLAGLGMAALCAVPGGVRRALSWRNAALALIFFLAGAYPFLRYSKRYRMETFRTNVSWSIEGWKDKFYVAASTLDGSSLIGYVTFDDPADRPRAPRNQLERLSAGLDDLAGRPRYGVLGYSLAFSVLLLPFLWRSPARRPVVFAMVFLLTAWGLMFFGRGAGGSSHHVALLWPWPQFLVAAAFAEASRRLGRAGVPVLVLATALVCCKATLSTNVHLSQFIRNGAAGSWTDAVYGLSGYLGSKKGQQVVLLDWGMFEPLRLLHRGRLPLVWGADPLRALPPSPDDVRIFQEMTDQPNRLFVSYTDTHEQFARVNERLRQMLGLLGRHREVLKVIQDSNGRSVYEVFAIRRRYAE